MEEEKSHDMPSMAAENIRRRLSKPIHSSPRFNPYHTRPDNFKSRQSPMKSEKFFLIPWRGRILEATHSDLKNCLGNLDMLQNLIGSRETRPEELNYKLRFVWRNCIMWPSQQELLRAKGNLNVLLDICKRSMMIPPPDRSFRPNGPTSSMEFPSGDH